MRVLIVFHGQLPGGEYPATGIAVRAFTNGTGLEAHGLEVCYASRRRDLIGPPTPALPPVHPFEGRQGLADLVKRLAPDLVLLEGAYENAALAGLDVPIALDLFAPRMLEGQWEALDVSQEMIWLLDAVARADYFLVTSERQRYYYIGIMTLAGVDCREDRIATVPLSLSPDRPERQLSPEPLLVAGGVAWPWQDPRWTLTRVRERLVREGEGALHLLRGPYPLGKQGARIAPLPVEEGPPVTVHPLLTYPEMNALLSRAWAVIDVSAPNLEREMALSFRQLDALRCGVPLVVGDHVPLAPAIEAHEAGWVVPNDDEAALNRVLDELLSDSRATEQRGQNARALGQDVFSAEVTIAPLVAQIHPPMRRRRGETAPAALARRCADADARFTQLERLEQQVKTLGKDLRKKDRENRALDGKVRELMDTVGHLSTSLEAALYQQEQVARIIATQEDEQRLELVAVQRALSEAKREVSKKEREVARLLGQRDQWEVDATELEQECARAERGRDEARAEVAGLRGRTRAVEEQLVATRSELEMVRGDLLKKQQEVERLWATRDTLNEDIARLVARLRSADKALAARESVLEEEKATIEAMLEDERTEKYAAREQLIKTEQALRVATEEIERLRFFEQEVVRLNDVIIRKDEIIDARSVAGFTRTVRAKARELRERLRQPD